jgi:hypothetical protein
VACASRCVVCACPEGVCRCRALSNPTKCRTLGLSRFVSVLVCDNSGKDLLGVAHLVEINNDSTFHDVLADLPSEVTNRELLEVKLREFESSPDSKSLTLRQVLLSKTLSEIDDVLEQHRKCRPGQPSKTFHQQPHLSTHKMLLRAWLLRDKQRIAETSSSQSSTCKLGSHLTRPTATSRWRCGDGLGNLVQASSAMRPRGFVESSSPSLYRFSGVSHQSLSQALNLTSARLAHLCFRRWRHSRIYMAFTHHESWSVYPLCEACAVQGFEGTSVRKTKAQSKRCARAKKRARPAPAAGYNRSVSASE